MHTVAVIFSREGLVSRNGTLLVMLKIGRSLEGSWSRRNNRTYAKKGDDLLSTTAAFYELLTVFIWSCIESAWTCEHGFTPEETTKLLTYYSSLLIAYSHANLLLSLSKFLPGGAWAVVSVYKQNYYKRVLILWTRAETLTDLFIP